MYQFERLTLDNYLTWDQVELEFKPGITQIFGENRSGKSVLVSPLKAILYDSLNIPKSGHATLSFRDSQHTYDFSAFNKGKTRNNFKIVIDEADQAVETRDAGIRLIHDHFGFFLQESLFDTTVSISALREHPLASGKASSRLDWIHDIFAYASLLDGYIERVEKAIKPAREGSIKFKLLKEQLGSLEKPEELDTSPDKLRSDLEACQAKLQKVESRLRDIENVRLYLNTSTKKARYPLGEARERHKKANRVWETLSRAKLEHEAYQTRKPRYDKLKAKVNTAKEAYVDACAKYDQEAKNPATQITILEDTHKDVRKRLEEAQTNNEVYEEQSELRELAGKKLKEGLDKDELRQTVEDNREQLSILKRTLKSVRSGDERCSVCGSDISASTHNPKKLTAQIQELEEDCTRIERQLAIMAARKTNFADYVDVAPLKSAKEQLSQLIACAQAYLDAKEALDNFGGLDEPVEYTPSSYQKAKERVQQAEDDLIAAKAEAEAAASREHLLEGNPYATKSLHELEEAEESLQTRQRKLVRRVSSLSDTLVHTQTQQALVGRYRKERSRLIQEAKPLRNAADDFNILTSLRKALGRDGFRTKRLEDTLALFVANLNALAPLIWKEAYKFEIETGPRKCDVVVHRNKMRGDVFTLSGSERRSWQLISALAILRILPDNRRCDTIILDELEANMSASSRHMMMRDFLPELQKTVPNVVVISPLSSRELGLQADQMYTVVKQNNRSTLRL